MTAQEYPGISSSTLYVVGSSFVVEFEGKKKCIPDKCLISQGTLDRLGFDVKRAHVELFHRYIRYATQGDVKNSSPNALTEWTLPEIATEYSISGSNGRFSPSLFVESFIQKHPVFYDKNGLWWVWEGNKYILTDETHLLNLMSENKPQDGIIVKDKLLLLALRLQGRLTNPHTLPKCMVQFNSKVLNVNTLEVIDADPHFFSTNPIPWELGDSEDTPIIDRMLEEWVGKEWIPTMYEIMAYCTLSDYPIHVVFFLIGSGGNGKTSFLNLIKEFVGSNNYAVTDLDLLSDSRFETTAVYKKLVCVVNETNSGILRKTSNLKAYSGGGAVRFEFKGKQSFTDVNYAKVLIATNSLPEFVDNSDAIYRRSFVIEFKNTFTGNRDVINLIPEVEFKNLAFKCSKILIGLLRDGSFTNFGTVDSRREKYQNLANPLNMFIQSCIDMSNPNAMESFSKVYSVYVNWLKDGKMRVVSARAFRDQLMMLGLEVGNRQVPNQNTVMLVVFGVSLKIPLVEACVVREGSVVKADWLLNGIRSFDDGKGACVDALMRCGAMLELTPDEVNASIYGALRDGLIFKVAADRLKVLD